MNHPTRIIRQVVRYPDGRVVATEQVEFATLCDLGAQRAVNALNSDCVDDNGITFAPSMSWFDRLMFNLFAD